MLQLDNSLDGKVNFEEFWMWWITDIGAWPAWSPCKRTASPYPKKTVTLTHAIVSLELSVLDAEDPLKGKSRKKKRSKHVKPGAGGAGGATETA